MQNLNEAFAEATEGILSRAALARKMSGDRPGEVSAKSLEVSISRFASGGEMKTRTLEDLTEALPPAIEADMLLRSLRPATKRVLAKRLKLDDLSHEELVLMLNDVANALARAKVRESTLDDSYVRVG